MQLNYLTAMRRAASNPQIFFNGNNPAEAGALQMEHAFLDSLWIVINPTQQQACKNAILYDILLLMIYNIGGISPLMQTAQSLSEYLVKLYANVLPHEVSG